ncbi:ANTAR domain-containing response regulator [Streptomyces sp. CBMA152]|uniref:ANTAR domain-containing response regulator n=1 Tax=Streptomyces sp. CBMA152 TaxID=1896312 RepID=UPI0016604963|nr:GAF and ANTAR domain-containing protein [Streptomyces sp. CBMA152]MBD0741583.1 transcriptional regulator [Streptomyces sp. CBMA152]
MLYETERQRPESASATPVRMLSRLAEQSVRCAPATCGAVATIADSGPERRVTATHPDLAPLVSVQLACGDGPIPTALDVGAPVDSEDLLTEDRWPGYRALALESGVRACVTLPFRRSGIEVTLSLYSFRPGPLDEAARSVIGILGEETTARLVRERRYHAALAEVEQLETALRSRPVIDQASGIVMHVLGCGAEDAFGVLRSLSQRANRKLSEVAEGVVRTKGRGLEDELAALHPSA